MKLQIKGSAVAFLFSDRENYGLSDEGLFIRPFVQQPGGHRFYGKPIRKREIEHNFGPEIEAINSLQWVNNTKENKAAAYKVLRLIYHRQKGEDVSLLELKTA